MSDVVIGPKKEFFTWLPNCIVYDWGLSAEALGVALYLNGKSAGWQARPFDIQKHFKFGETKWERISKELRDYGLLELRTGSKGSSLWFQLPDMGLPIKRRPGKTPTRQNQPP